MKKNSVLTDLLYHRREREEQTQLQQQQEEEEQQQEEEELFKLRRETSLFVTCKPWLHRLSQIHGLPYMINLTSLTLHMNELSELNVDVLSHLLQLEELDLSGNEITEISAETFAAQQKLKRLNLSSNQLTHIAPTSFKFLYSLQWLCLAFNEFDDITALSYIPPTAPLLHVDVCGNRIGKLESVQRALSTHGEKLRSLRLRIPRASQITPIMLTSTSAEKNDLHNNAKHRGNAITKTESYETDNISSESLHKSQNTNERRYTRWSDGAESLPQSTNKVKGTKEKGHWREEWGKEKESNLPSSHKECVTEIPFVHENPFLQEFALRASVNEDKYVKQILQFCPNLHTLDGDICGVNVLELIEHTLPEQGQKQNEEEQMLSQEEEELEEYEEEVGSSIMSKDACTKRNHSYNGTVDDNKVNKLETRPTRSHSRPLLTSPHATNTNKNRSVTDLSFSSSSPESTSSSSSTRMHSALEESSHTREGSKVAAISITNNTSTRTTARSLDYSAAVNCNKLETESLADGSSYDVSLIEAELNDVICRKHEGNVYLEKQEPHSLQEDNNHFYGSLHGHSINDTLFNSSGKEKKALAQSVSLSNFMLEKMPQADKPIDGEMELCELRSGRPVHSLRWRPHRRSTGLNTLISFNAKENRSQARCELERADHTTDVNKNKSNNTDCSTEKVSRNEDFSGVNASGGSRIHQKIENGKEASEMQRVLDAFDLHSEMIDALQLEKKNVNKRLGKAMQQMALQRATEAELHQEFLCARKTFTQYKVKSTHTINKQQSQISSLKDELLRQKGEIQIMHKRFNADLTSLQQHLTRTHSSSLRAWTSLFISEFIARAHLFWQEWSDEREQLITVIYYFYNYASMTYTRQLQNELEQTHQLDEWYRAQIAGRKQIANLQEEITRQNAQWKLWALETAFRQRLIEQEQELRSNLLTQPYLQKSTELITRIAVQKAFDQLLICKEAEWSREYDSMKTRYEEALAHAKDELHKSECELARCKKQLEQLQHLKEREASKNHSTDEASERQLGATACYSPLDRGSASATIPVKENSSNTLNSSSTAVDAEASWLLNKRRISTQANTASNSNVEEKEEVEQQEKKQATEKLQVELNQSNQDEAKVAHHADTVSELVSYWKAMCVKREHEIEQLRVACNVSESTQQVLSNENSRLLHKVGEEAKEYEIRQSQFARERDNLLRALHNVEDSLKKKDHELNLLEEEAKIKIDEKRTRIAELEQTNDELVEEQKNVAQQNVKLRSSLEAVEKELQETKSAVRSAEHANEIQLQRIESLEKKLHELQTGQQKSNTIQEELIKTKSALVAALRSARDQLVTLHQSHLTLSQQQQLWESMYASKDEEVRRLQREVAELQSSSRERQRATLAALSQVILNEHSTEPVS